MTSEQREYLAKVEILRRHSVASVSISNGSSLTTKEVVRMKKVSEDLANNRNPYYDENNESKVTRGGEVPQHIRDKDRVDSKVVIRHSTIKPSYKSDGGRMIVDNDTMNLLGFDLVKPTPIVLPEFDPFLLEHTVCSFCNTVTPNNRVTRGVGLARKIMVEELRTDALGNEISVQVVKHTTDKLAACPNCCLLIPKIQFPYSEG